MKELGVVPEKVQRFIAEVERSGGAAKICGAGSVAGDQAGVILAVAEEASILTEICARYRYSLIPAMAEPRGVHVI